MTQRKRTVFFISDGTGITSEMLGHTLLTQFEGIAIAQVTVPFIDNEEKARSCVERISEAGRSGQGRPIVFSTLIDVGLRDIIRGADAFVLDFFESFLDPLEVEFGVKSVHAVGRSHGVLDKNSYQSRIEAVNFALAHDDGVSVHEIGKADVVLIGVSRSGKTPTCLYLALQFGIKASNYPLIPEDFDRMQLPEPIRRHRAKLFGLSIAPERLREIRNQRRPDSQYARMENCRYEVLQAETLMHREGIRWVDSTAKSIEEIASTIMQEFRLERRGH